MVSTKEDLPSCNEIVFEEIHHKESLKNNNISQAQYAKGQSTVFGQTLSFTFLLIFESMEYSCNELTKSRVKEMVNVCPSDQFVMKEQLI